MMLGYERTPRNPTEVRQLSIVRELEDFIGQNVYKYEQLIEELSAELNMYRDMVHQEPGNTGHHWGTCLRMFNVVLIRDGQWRDYYRLSCFLDDHMEGCYTRFPRELEGWRVVHNSGTCEKYIYIDADDTLAPAHMRAYPCHGENGHTGDCLIALRR